MDPRGGGKSDYRSGTRSEQVTHELITGLWLAADHLENAPAGFPPAAAVDVAADLSVAIPGGTGLADAEDPIRHSTFRIGLEHPLTIADSREAHSETCG